MPHHSFGCEGSEQKEDYEISCAKKTWISFWNKGWIHSQTTFSLWKMQQDGSTDKAINSDTILAEVDSDPKGLWQLSNTMKLIL